MKKIVMFSCLCIVMFLSGCEKISHEKLPDGLREQNLVLQNAERMDRVSEDRIISDIQNNYGRTNNDIETYTKIEKDLLGQSTEGGSVVYYSKNDASQDVEKIVATYFGETGKLVNEFYYKDSVLLFVFEENYEYNRPIYWDEQRAEESQDNEVFDLNKSKITESRYYFYNNKLIRWLDENDKEVPVDLNLFKDKEISILQQSKELLEQF